MNQAEVTRFALPCLAVVGIVGKHNLEKCLVVPRIVIFWPSCEFLVSWHQRGCNVVGNEVGQRVNVEQLDNILMTDNTAATGLRQGFRWDNLPVVVRIVVPISCHLLP